ncbi:ABC transporter permease [Rhodothermus bifroesti]|uniref:ABC transporter permease n=1 Tax=Rhodothermus bifroesti TaxID=2823335 RepID=UPI001AEF9673|nr:ABC transporter permease [Rhodothermus bifroesti]
MSNITQAIGVELLKARRSKMPLLTALGFSLAPFAGGFFMIVMKDPDLARRMGIISAKAQILAGSADWQTYLGFLAQATAVGGFMVFAFVCSWIFGREYSDHTITDLLALPTSRSTIVLAKFVVFILWSTILVALIYLIGLGVGAAIALPAASAQVFRQGTITIVVTACLTIAVTTPVSFFASTGPGYLPALGAAILAVVLAQVVAAAGWGEYFPWCVPALYAGMAGPQYADLGGISYVIVIVTSLVGLIGTLVWWELADHTY